MLHTRDINYDSCEEFHFSIEKVYYEKYFNRSKTNVPEPSVIDFNLHPVNPATWHSISGQCRLQAVCNIQYGSDISTIRTSGRALDSISNNAIWSCIILCWRIFLNDLLYRTSSGSISFNHWSYAPGYRSFAINRNTQLNF